MTNELSVEDAIEALYTVRAYYASLTAGYPKGKDCRGIGDVMCSEIANSCLMAIKALESQRWIPVSERLPLCEQEVLICTQSRTIGGKTKSIITSAIYEDGNMRECYSRWRWEDIEYESWDEEEDCGIIPEGWWEYRHYNPDEVYNNLVDDFILAWMPLPQPYKVESEEE